MLTPENKNKQRLYTVLSFAIPFFAMLILMLVRGSSPFGKVSMLYSDMYHQYYPFFKAFRAALLSGDSLLYNWSIGLGIDFLGLYSYYLASPLNLLSILIPEGWLLGYFSLLVPIKLGLASMFFGIFLQKIFQKCDLSIPMFASFYGFCAWALGYQWNVMWLDTFALLPLVILGMVSLLRDKKFVLYTVTLFLSVAINYYVGLFTCIFVFLCFICFEVCRYRGIIALLKDLQRIAIFSIIAITMTAVIALPTLAALQNTQSSVNQFPEGWQLNMTTEDNWVGLFKTMAVVAGNMSGGINYTLKEGNPNVYCGVFATILAIIYLFNGKIRIRDKICAVLLLLFLNVSFIVRQLDYIWHGFHFTNMIPYRFSFLYSFVMLYMAYSAWINRKSIRIWQIAIALAACIGLMFGYDGEHDLFFWGFNITFLAFYITLLVLHSIVQIRSRKDNEPITLFKYQVPQPVLRAALSLLLLVVIAFEMIFNLVNFSLIFPSTNISNYPRGTHTTAAAIKTMKDREKETLFYRAEVAHSQTLNDGALNGYNGISTFTSSANVKVTEFMKAFGYGAKNTYNRYCFEQSSPVANLFLNLKYMIDRDSTVGESPYLDEVYRDGLVRLLENNAYLPLGFLTSPQLLNVDFENENRFNFQNELIKEATGLYEDVWYMLPATALTITGDCPLVTPQPITGYCSYATTESTGTVTYTYTANQEGYMCVNFNLSKKNNFSIWYNGRKLYGESYSLPQMLSVCNVRPGDVVEIRLDCKANEKGNTTIQAALLNEEVFRSAIDILSRSTLELTNFRNTLVEGTIDCYDEGVLYTSIPQDGNWHAYVDENEVDTVLVGDVMIGILLSEGEHTIRFEYRNEAFSLGLKITIVSMLLFVGIYFVQYKPNLRRYQGKYLKKKQ